MIYCPKCGNGMSHKGTDSRQEWFTENWACPICERSFTRKVIFKTQSRMIESDVLTEDGN